MFIMLPAATSILCIYVIAAILPSLLLLRYIYKEDKIEPEPGYLLRALFFLGLAAVIASIVLEWIGTNLLPLFVSTSFAYYKAVYAFAVVAVVEEGTKFFFLKRRTWRDPAFNYRFDGVVYAVFIGLGFAAFENIEYVFNYGLTVVLTRALFAIPGHMGFAVFMGTFYGRAKLFYDRGMHGRCRANLIAAYVSAVFLHGFYDACAMIGTSASTTVFIGFVIVMYIVVITLIRKESKTDSPV